MEPWQTLLRNSITTYEDLKKHFKCENPQLSEVIRKYPLRINPYFLDLIKKSGDPLYKQAVPDMAELNDPVCMEDPLGEELHCPARGIVHKYPDRALMFIHNQCAMYCRFCTRKRMVGMPQMVVNMEQLHEGFAYLEKTPSIREVLLSGGDPLLLEDDVLEYILQKLHQIKSIEVIRIGTRAPATLPMRVTDHLAALLKQFHPLYINTHFNHPDELTQEAALACAKLADAGIPLGCQTVLLHGINDTLPTLKKLFLGLLRIRVKPYYLFQADLTKGTNHFRTATKDGILLMKSLYGHVSGMAVPTFALDGPGGKGKIPLTPDYICQTGENLIFENYRGERCSYPEPFDVP